MSRAIGSIEILPDPLALAHHVADWITQVALAAQGSFRVSLSGGSTPKTLYGLLASDEFRDRFPWPRVSWYWGDEPIRRLRAAGVSPFWWRATKKRPSSARSAPATVKYRPREVQPVGELLWFVDQAAAGEGQARERSQ